MAGEHRHDADEPVADDQRVAGERDHPLAACPFLIAHAGVADGVVGQMGPPLLGDEPDLELADRHPGVRPVDVRVHPRARLEHQHVPRFTERPDARERAFEVADHGLAAAPQHVSQAIALDKGDPDVDAEECQPRAAPRPPPRRAYAR